jgi:hypothetical protein
MAQTMCGLQYLHQSWILHRVREFFTSDFNSKNATFLGFKTKQFAYKRRWHVENRRLWTGAIFRLAESTVFASGCD